MFLEIPIPVLRPYITNYKINDIKDNILISIANTVLGLVRWLLLCLLSWGASSHKSGLNGKMASIVSLQQEGPWFNVWSLYVLLIFAWVSSRYSGFSYKNMYSRLNIQISTKYTNEDLHLVPGQLATAPQIRSNEENKFTVHCYVDVTNKASSSNGLTIILEYIQNWPRYSFQTLL